MPGLICGKDAAGGGEGTLVGSGISGAEGHESTNPLDESARGSKLVKGVVGAIIQ